MFLPNFMIFLAWVVSTSVEAVVQTPYQKHELQWDISPQKLNIKHQTSLKSPEPRKKPSYFPLYWLVNKDPLNGLL